MPAFWSRLLRRRRRPSRPHLALSPNTELRSELGQILGYYSLHAADVPSKDLGVGNIVVYGHPGSADASPAVTAAHEQAHYRLINSTAFGLLFKQIAGGDYTDQPELIERLLAAQWRAQETAATYTGLATAASDAFQLDQLVSLLPSQALGQSPYREAFEAIDALFPLSEASNDVELSAYLMVVEAVSTWALSGNVLPSFRVPHTLTVESLEAYLKLGAPDRRLEEMLARLRPASDREGIVKEVKATFLRVAEAAGGFPDADFWRLVARLQALLPLASNADLEQRLTDMSRFRTAWSSSSLEEAERAWVEPREEPTPTPFPAPLPEVIVGGQHLVPYTPGLVEIRSGDRVDTGYTAAELADADRGRRALLLAVRRNKLRSRLYFRPTVYRTAEDGVSPESPDAALVQLIHHSGPLHACDAEDFVAAVTGLEVPVSTLVFLGHSWTHWHLYWAEKSDGPRVLDGFGPPWRDGFGDVVRLCIEADLSEAHLLMLLAGVGLYEAPECFLLGYPHEQHVACMLDRTRPGVYLLQLLSGQLGFEVFDEIARRRRMRMLEVGGGAVRIPHLALLEFVGKSMVFEAMSRSGEPFVL